MQAAGSQHQGYAGRHIEIAARLRRARHRGDEIRHVMRTIFRPAFADQVAHDIRCIADQVVAAGIVFEIIITALPADQQRRRRCSAHGLGRQIGCPVHPGQHDIRPEAVYFRCECGHRPAVEETAERQFDNIDAGSGEAGTARLVRPGHHLLGNALFVKGNGETDKELLGPADCAARHGLHKPHTDSKRSKAAAASSQLQLRCRERAASCCDCQSASSLSRAIARSAKAASSAAT